MVLLDPDAFLTQFTRILEKSRAKGTIYVTLKRYAGKEGKNVDAVAPADCRCLVRAVGAKQSLPRHETTADGRLVLTPETPLLAHRYRFMHVLVESDLSQMICAVDTYRHCEPTAEGRRQPLVAIKVLNARHWALGAQEHKRVRRLRRGGDGAHCAHVVLPLGHFEVGGHFCIVLELLRELTLLCEAAPPPVRLSQLEARLSLTAAPSGLMPRVEQLEQTFGVTTAGSVLERLTALEAVADSWGI